MDDLERVLHDTVRHHLLAVVAALAHQRVGQALHDGALGGGCIVVGGLRLTERMVGRSVESSDAAHVRAPEKSFNKPIPTAYLGLAEALLLVPPRGVGQVGGALARNANVVLQGEVLDLHVA